MRSKQLGIRWTIGNVSANGFEALRLSIWGAWHLFGTDAAYAVCMNGLSIEVAQQRTGSEPAIVVWRPCERPPDCVAEFLDSGMAEGTAWKLAPIRVFSDRFELALDNDCILWRLPAAVSTWLSDRRARCLLAADVTLAHGAFTHLTRSEPRNTGIRGFPPHYDFAAAIAAVLDRHPNSLRSELDEQGLQIAALDLSGPAHVVSIKNVPLWPFWPKSPHLGRCGAHFAGLNCRTLPWSYYGVPACECLDANWQRHRTELYRRVGAPPPR